MHPVIIVILIIGGLLFFSWCKRQPPEIRTKAIIYAAIAVIAVLVATGRMNWLMGAIGAGIAMFQRVLMATSLFSKFKSMGGPKPGNSSAIETQFLRMKLDHDSGDLSGVVLKGSFKGTALSDLDLTQLLDLLSQCRAEDHQSAVVLESYLEQRFGDQWRIHSDSGAGRRNSTTASGMTRQEALEILGVDANASKEDIIKAHKRLMQRLHPDRGGSTYLAAKINQAKDILIST